MARLITRQEAAAMLDVDKQTISNWIENGVINGKNIKKNGSTRTYVDKNTITALFDDIKAIQEAKAKMEAIRKETEEEYNKVNFENLFVKAHPIEYSSMLLIHDLAKDVIHFTSDGMLNEKQKSILERFMNGWSISDIASEYNLSRERVRQILSKCARIIYQASTFKDIVKKSMELQEKIDELQQAYKTTQKTLDEANREIRIMRDKYGVLTTMDKAPYVPEENDTDLGRLINTFKIRLVDCDLTVRCLNCCKSIGVETVGDAVQLQKIDFLKARNFGRKSLTELDELIEGTLGLHFNMDVEKYFRLWNEQQEGKIPLNRKQMLNIYAN